MTLQVMVALQTNLGRERADFGELKNVTAEWLFQDRTTHCTRIIFPEGRSDRRYYLNWVPDDTDPPVFVCVSKSRGRLKKEWIVTLQPRVGTHPAGMGTLLHYLEQGEGYHPKHVPPEARSTLNARKGFAHYHWQPAVGTFLAGYIREDGLIVSRKGVEPKGPWHLPHAPVPYPITDAEREAIKRKRKPNLLES